MLVPGKSRIALPLSYKVPKLFLARWANAFAYSASLWRQKKFDDNDTWRSSTMTAFMAQKVMTVTRSPNLAMLDFRMLTVERFELHT